MNCDAGWEKDQWAELMGMNLGRSRI
jgi:hypothetical protein